MRTSCAKGMTVMKPLIGLVALGWVAGGVLACGGTGHAPEASAPEPVAVSVTPVAAVDTAERLEAGGVVAAPESASISSRIVATIAGVSVTAGDRVRAGDALVRLDARAVSEQTAQARAGARAAERVLAQARTEQSAAEAEHRLAAAWHRRITTLHARQSAADQERDEAEARLSAAVARLAGVQAAIESAGAQLETARSGIAVAEANESFTVLRAPFDGVVTERLADPGNLAVPGTPLLQVDSDGPRQVVARVDEARAAFVRPGDVVRAVIDEHGTGGDGVEAVVAEVARAVGADQRAFTVKVGLPPDVTARTGRFARLVFRGAPRRALFVPPGAVQRHGQVASVYVVQDDIARLRLVRVGAATSEGVEVLAGLDPGEAIVIAPPPRLVDGTTVTIAAPGGSGGRS
jgi:RND family efflux transporter MFP subunit